MYIILLANHFSISMIMCWRIKRDDRSIIWFNQLLWLKSKYLHKNASHPNHIMEPANNILTFQTIMTMLNILQDGPTGHKPGAFFRNTDDLKAQKLLVLNAIVTLLVRQYEVTSVASAAKWNKVNLVASLAGTVCSRSVHGSKVALIWIINHLHQFHIYLSHEDLYCSIKTSKTTFGEVLMVHQLLLRDSSEKWSAFWHQWYFY